MSEPHPYAATLEAESRLKSIRSTKRHLSSAGPTRADNVVTTRIVGNTTRLRLARHSAGALEAPRLDAARVTIISRNCMSVSMLVGGTGARNSAPLEQCQVARALVMKSAFPTTNPG